MEVVDVARVWTAAMAPERARDEVDRDGELVAACRRGDEKAFAELVRRHQRRIFRLAGRFFRHHDEVEDAAQQTFLRAWTKLGSYRGEAPFENWLTRVCLNCCYERLRQRPGEEALAAEPPAPASDPDARLEVERLLTRLGPSDRFLLLLLYGEGWTVAEIAERLGWSRSNVKVRAHRARRRLRKLLQGDAGE